MSRRVLIVTNPGSGRGSATTEARRFVDAVRANHLTVEVEMVGATTAHETEILLRRGLRRSPDVVIAVGGDGLVHLVVQHLVGTPTPLAVLPVGSGNDFARALCTPLSDCFDRVVRAAARTVLVTSPVDVLRVTRGSQRSYVVGSVSFGIDAAVNRRANGFPRWMGGAKYVVAAICELAIWRSVEIGVKAGVGGSTYRGPMTLVTVSNIPTLGGGIPLAPGAAIDDGRAVLTMARRLPRWRLVSLFMKLLRGTHIDGRRVRAQSIDEVTLDVPDDLIPFGDGEPLGGSVRCVEVVPAALRIAQ